MSRADMANGVSPPEKRTFWRISSPPLAFYGSQKGVTIIEYALIAGLISVVAIALLSAKGASVKKIFSSINDALTTA